MNRIIEDKFVSNLIGFKSYISKGNISSELLNKIKNPFFLTIKSPTRLIFRSNIKSIKISLFSKLIYFERKFNKNKFIHLNCRKAKKRDVKQIINIANENTSNSRFIKDKLIPIYFKKKYRATWVYNFFKKKRGDFLIVAEKKNKILGFILIIKKKNNFIIDLIVSSKKNRKKKVASSLINYINNQLMNNKNKITAGTQVDNFIAIKMYKKLGFIKKKNKTFYYHIHSK